MTPSRHPTPPPAGANGHWPASPPPWTMAGALRTMARPAALPPGLALGALALFLVGGIGPNSLLALLAIAVLLIGGGLLWRPGEAPIFLFVLVYQWLGASMKIFQANWLGLSVEDYAPFGGEVTLAIVLSLLSVLIFAAGLRLGAGRWRAEDGQLAASIASRHSLKTWFRLYLMALAGATLAQSFAWVVAGLAQPLLALANVKWAFFWMLAYATFVRPRADRRYFLAAFAIEFVLGIGGYFSQFKTVFFYAAFALAASHIRITPRKMAGLGVVVVVVLVLGAAWTAVKPEYRAYVSGGTRQQVVTVGFADRIKTLGGMVGALDSDALLDGFNRLLDRISYVDFFAVVLTRVPDLIPHEHGRIWFDAVRRPFMPRLFFPSKSNIADSARTNLYTGLGVAGAAQGTNIPIGYVGESYIDFGAIGMFAPILAFGLLLGRVYHWLLRSRLSRGALGMGLAVVVVFPTYGLESSVTKVFGGVAVVAIVCWGLVRFLAPRFFPWIRA